MSAPSEAGAAPQTFQILGLAFAGADLVFEVDAKGTVTFALGAVKSVTGLSESEMLRKRWTQLVAPADGAFLATLQHEIKAGERRGPFPITLAGGRRRTAQISIFRLPQNRDRISCAMSLAAGGAKGRVQRTERGMVPAPAFEQVAADALNQAADEGVEASLQMVEVPGLAAAVGAMDDDLAERTLAALAGLLRAESYGGSGAAEVAPDRFALVSAHPVQTDRLSQQLKDASGRALVAVAAGAPMGPGAVDAKLKTIRYVLDRYIQRGSPAETSSDLMSVVEGAARASATFRTAVGSGDFRLAYQPIVTLDGARLHHFEALARFNEEHGPAETIRMAEQLGLIVDFDLAVVKQVAKTLAATGPEVRIAANISGISLTAPDFLGAMAQILSASRVAADRLLLEVTETARIADIPEARSQIAALRKRGHPVCLDDFGAGAASIEYLTAFEFDFVKIDGSFVKTLVPGCREALLIRHVAALCKDLGVLTVAEMVETPETTQMLRTLGVNLGQGWVFGKPTPEPKWAPPASARPPVQPAARRQGAMETWG